MQFHVLNGPPIGRERLVSLELDPPSFSPSKRVAKKCHSYNLESRRTTSFFQNPSKRNFSRRSPTGDFPSFPGGRPKGEEFKKMSPSHFPILPLLLLVLAVVLSSCDPGARRGGGRGRGRTPAAGAAGADGRTGGGEQVGRSRGGNLTSAAEGQQRKEKGLYLFSKIMWENGMLLIKK